MPLSNGCRQRFGVVCSPVISLLLTCSTAFSASSMSAFSSALSPIAEPQRNATDSAAVGVAGASNTSGAINHTGAAQSDKQYVSA